jgi:uncharacterized membrane protein YdjX (TVP38/TMEM64 family)
MNWKRIMNILGMAVIILLLVWINKSYLNFRPVEIRDWILSFGWWAPLFFIIATTLRPLILFPTSILSLAAGLAFGAIEGFVYIELGALGGATVGFLASSWIGKSIVKKPSQRVSRIRERMKEQGFFYVLFLRIVPFLNFDLVSYLAGIAKVRYRSYITATAIGVLPGTFGYVLLGSSIVTGSRMNLYIAITIFLVILIVSVLNRGKLKEWVGTKE